jgi:hypothetical protein
MGDPSLEKDGADCYITDPGWDALGDFNQVLDAADELVIYLTGAARLIFGSHVQLATGPAFYRDEDGVTHQYGRIVDRIRISDHVTVTVLGTDGQVVSRYAPGDVIPQWMQVAGQSKTARQILELIGSEPLDYATLYKLYELVQHDVGDIVETYGYSKSLVGRFRQTANSPKTIGVVDARHGAWAGDTPARNPLRLPEAQAFVRGLIARWFAAQHQAAD